MDMRLNIGEDFAPPIVIWSVLVFAFIAVTHITSALTVYRDARSSRHGWVLVDRFMWMMGHARGLCHHRGER